MGKIVITGGAGYLGRVLADRLSRRHEVTVVDSLLYNQPIPEDAAFVREDVRNLAKMNEILADQDFLIHLAGVVGEPACNVNKDLALQVNLLASKELVSRCSKNRISVIYPSSCSVYGFANDLLIDERGSLQPLSLYAISKVAEENAVVSSGAEYLILRLGTLFGYSPRMRFDLVVNRFIAQAIQDKRITIFGGKQFRPFIHVKDVAEAVEQCVDRKLTGLMNLGGRNYSIEELADMISSRFECEVQIFPEIVDQRNYRIDSSKLEKAISFTPTRGIDYAMDELRPLFDDGTIKSYRNPVYDNEEMLRAIKT